VGACRLAAPEGQFGAIQRQEVLLPWLPTPSGSCE
jgi:hypothetical protein